MKKRWLGMAAAAACGVSTVAWAAGGAAEIAAQLDWSQRVALAPSVSGVVREVLVQPGQTVAAGSVLLRLDPVPFKAALAGARADIERLSEEMAEAQRELDRVRDLYARTVASTTELDAARLRHARAKAELTAAQARSEQARYQLDETELRAPFAARVLERRAEPGTVVATQCQPPTLLVLARADQRRVFARLSGAAGMGLLLGSVAQVVVGEVSVPATLQAIQSLPEGRHEGVWLLDAAASRTLGAWPGATVTLRLP
ncbi:MAG: efflux RND transporter periplasmic adaptor subunit [Betaproteobacteria bacterium]|nr:MAG: efflux RND transporter periplasmic adaptor subunit [Betaproteobacteria bacterium]